MNFIKFILLEIGIVLLIALISSGAGTLGYVSIDPEFDVWGHMLSRVFLFALESIIVVGCIGGILLLKKRFPMEPQAAAAFAILLGLYLEAYRMLTSQYSEQTISIAFQVVAALVIPAVLGLIFFLRIKSGR